MGFGFTVDTPLKVSRFGIDSVMAIGNDILLEKLRKMYCEKFKIPYNEISNKIEDFRAKRVTSYLNLIKELAEKKFEELKNTSIEKGNEIREYFNMLPENSSIKAEFKALTEDYFDLSKVKTWLKENLSMGSLDVNIMTKLDKENYFNNEKLPVEFNDAHAALRGYANSNLSSSIILSAGMNPRLYSYFEGFEDFYPNEDCELNKKIVLKVSDYRSAFIQGKFFAKKGLWVSEYRIESGLNCGGHAFATDGFLMGPILSEFKENKEELIKSVHEVLIDALNKKGKTIPKKCIPLKITAQGGVGTEEEHQFLIDHYQLDSVGWGTPFLLVPEAVNIDNETLGLLADAKEKDLYLSGVSPLGVPFNNLRGSSKDLEKQSRIDKGKPGSPCISKFLILNSEFTDKPICTASRQYQNLKIEQLDKEDITEEVYQKKYQKVVEKECLCVGLSSPPLLVNDLETNKDGGDGVSVCPGPNMAYFSKEMNLKEIIDHIYGRTNVITRTDRPNLFIKELDIYMKYLTDKFNDEKASLTKKQKKHLLTFTENLKNGINYYEGLFNSLKNTFSKLKTEAFNNLTNNRSTLYHLQSEIENIEAI